jgi:hypothetical protein
MNTPTILLNVLGMVLLTVVLAAAMIGVPLFCDGIPHRNGGRDHRRRQTDSPPRDPVPTHRRRPSAQV